MATPNASSIVDFLKQRGFVPEPGERFPLFGQRKRIFEQLGLTAEQNEFRGTAQENLALLSRLGQAERESGVSISPENIFDISRTQAPAEIIPTPAPTVTEPPPVPTPTAQETTPGLTLPGLPTVPEGPELAQQALELVQSGATFPLQQEAVEAEKAAVRLSGQQNIEATIKQFASRGLFFSGARKKEVSNVEADTLARVLGVDRKFALLIASGLESAAQDIAREAQKGRAEAIQSLSALGFAINPVTNRIEPTLAARREQRAIRGEEVTEAREVRAEVREERLATQAQAQQELREAQFQLSQVKTVADLQAAQQRLSISQSNLQLAQQREARLANQLYTQSQNGKLRAFDVDPSDTEAADTLLFKGEPELKKLLQQREKGLSPGPIDFIADVFGNVWNGTKSFFSF